MAGKSEANIVGYPMQNDGEHIWLRQSVTLTVQGQTRTIEMAVPVRPGATADEVEALLSEADAGMQRLSRHLDAQVALLTGTAPLAAAHPAPAIAPATPSASTPPATHTVKEAPAVPAAPSTPARATAPQREQSPAASTTPPVRATASGPLAKPAAPAPEKSATPPVPLSVKDFIAAAQSELNLTPKQAMEQLGVKSLSGLNLREALEMLRRQTLRSGNPGNSAASSAPAAASTPPATASSSRAASATLPSTPARYFEEEDDDLDVTFSVDGDDVLEDEFVASGESIDAGAMPDDGFGDDDDAFDLDDVPDFGALPAPPAAPASRSAARRTAPATPPAEELEEIAMPPAQPVNGDMRARALQIIGHMRGIASGGTPTTQQRAAYRNIVVSELGEPEAKALVQGLWRVSAERLGAEQLDTLLSWGKRDSFREDAALVLAALRAER